VSLGNLWVKDGDLLWWWDISGLLVITFELDDGLCWDWWRWVSVGKVSTGGVGSTGGWVGVIVWD